MSAEKTTIALIALQTIATFVAALAAVAMWQSTQNLVKVTRDMLLANVPPEVAFRLETSPPFPTETRANVIVENRGSVDLVDVEIEAGGRFRSDEDDGKISVMKTYKVGKLKSKGIFKLSIWELAKRAIKQQKSLGDSFKKARDAGDASIDIHVRGRHGATGVSHAFYHCILVRFDSIGNLLVSELFLEGNSRRTVTSESNTVSQETITPIPK